MFKIIILLLGLAIGFGGGVWWGQKNPDSAAKLSAEEERRFLEAQLAINQQIQAKLDQLKNKASSTKTPGSGFLGGGQAPSADISDVKADAEKQQDEIRRHLDKIKR